ncbi:hypothetical protein PLESTB_001224800 [Pleodorina starrii]|uniref:Uncharacterized protein n=1 Tax=Pleodorina starrii TaxID=330485 RepID=A0A9W6BTX7_9CHLO|nr:hypothetical protein PLESTB_001224800 [Pleodorina starrii]
MQSAAVQSAMVVWPPTPPSPADPRVETDTIERKERIKTPRGWLVQQHMLHRRRPRGKLKRAVEKDEIWAGRSGASGNGAQGGGPLRRRRRGDGGGGGGAASEAAAAG